MPLYLNLALEPNGGQEMRRWCGSNRIPAWRANRSKSVNSSIAEAEAARDYVGHTRHSDRRRTAL